VPHLHLADTTYGNDIGTNNFSAECRVGGSSTGSDRDITCVAEVEELDLYFSELRANLSVGSDMCSYLVQKPYFFYRDEPGKGASQLSVTYNTAGDIIQSSPGVNPESGLPQCQYDYSEQGGGNCCVGNYTLKTIRQQQFPGQELVTITNGQWGGSAANCLDGPAMSDGAYLNGEGFPLPRMQYVGGTSYNESYKIDAALNRRHGSRSSLSNIYAGNFYKPSQHTGGKPKALQFPANLPQEKGVMPQDTYEWDCLDRSGQSQARIRLFIREWNYGPIAQGGNPDVTGTSPDFPEKPINDRLDWLDFGDNYPGLKAY
jgi:hypothetical protein